MSEYRVTITSATGFRSSYLTFGYSREEVMADARRDLPKATNIRVEEIDDTPWTDEDEAGLERYEEKRRRRISEANEY